MRRRQFITLISGAAAVWPLAVRAQQPAIPIIGFLNGTSSEGYSPYVAAFREGLKESGYVEGQNVLIEYRWAEGQYDQLPAMVADLVLRQVSVIVANTPANLAAMAATKTIPIVFTTGSDPVKIGMVASLNRPGGNITGVTSLTVEVMPKLLELARELMPAATDVALLVNPNSPQRAEGILKDAQAAADALRLRLHVLHATTNADIENAFADFAQLKASVLVIGADAFFTANSRLLANLSLRYSVPTIYEYKPFAEAGGLISYGGSNKEAYRWAGVYTGRILKGAKPADLPVQQTTTVELIVNLKTAKALGVTVPLSLLGRADEVIE
jgi:putative tryptophan/tyrosine transport system substrate-binding protein